MYSATVLAQERQRERLVRAQQVQQVQQVRKLQRASRRASRAERNLTRALNEVLRARSDLHGGA